MSARIAVGFAVVFALAGCTRERAAPGRAVGGGPVTTQAARPDRTTALPASAPIGGAFNNNDLIGHPPGEQTLGPNPANDPDPTGHARPIESGTFGRGGNATSAGSGPGGM